MIICAMPDGFAPEALDEAALILNDVAASRRALGEAAVLLSEVDLAAVKDKIKERAAGYGKRILDAIVALMNRIRDAIERVVKEVLSTVSAVQSAAQGKMFHPVEVEAPTSGGADRAERIAGDKIHAAAAVAAEAKASPERAKSAAEALRKEPVTVDRLREASPVAKRLVKGPFDVNDIRKAAEKAIATAKNFQVSVGKIGSAANAAKEGGAEAATVQAIHAAAEEAARAISAFLAVVVIPFKAALNAAKKASAQADARADARAARRPAPGARPAGAA